MNAPAPWAAGPPPGQGWAPGPPARTCRPRRLRGRAVALLVTAGVLVVVAALVLGLRAWWNHTTDQLADTLDRLPLPPHATLVGQDVEHGGDGPARVTRYYRVAGRTRPMLDAVAAYSARLGHAGYVGVDEQGHVASGNLTAHLLPPLVPGGLRTVAPLRFEPAGCSADGGFTVMWPTPGALAVSVDSRVLACR